MKPRQPRYGDVFAGHDEGEAMAELARVKWAEYSADLIERNLFTKPRAGTLDRLVRAVVEYETYYPLAAAEGPVRVSDDGGQYVNMLWSQCKNLNELIMKLEKSLLLTPESVGEKAPAKVVGNKAKADSYLSAH